MGIFGGYGAGGGGLSISFREIWRKKTGKPGCSHFAGAKRSRRPAGPTLKQVMKTCDTKVTQNDNENTFISLLDFRAYILIR